MKIGCDITRIGRFENISEEFLQKYFTAEEIEYVKSKYHRTQTIAGIFSAKEAVFKTFSADEVPILANIEILRSRNIPAVKLHGGYAEKYKTEISVSISHDGDYAIAYALRN